MILHVTDPFFQLGYIHLCQFGNVPVPYPIRQRLTVQTVSVAFRALCLGYELVSPLLSGRGVVILHDRTEILDDAVERNEVVGSGMDKLLGNLQFLQRTI